MSVPGIQMMGMPGGLGHQEWPHRGSSSLDLSLKKKKRKRWNERQKGLGQESLRICYPVPSAEWITVAERGRSRDLLSKHPHLVLFRLSHVHLVLSCLVIHDVSQQNEWMGFYSFLQLDFFFGGVCDWMVRARVSNQFKYAPQPFPWDPSSIVDPLHKKTFLAEL